MSQEYQLILSKRKTISLQVTPQATLVVRAPRFVELSYIERLIERKQNWINTKLRQLQGRKPAPVLSQKEVLELKKKARLLFISGLNQWSTRMNLKFKAFRLSSAKTRWGSCSGGNVISLNWKLILTNQNLVDYVIIHELAHIKHKNHGSDFWNLVQSYDPDWKIHRKELNTFASWLGA
jgi:predicted metal-dependent hydrolase